MLIQGTVGEVTLSDGVVPVGGVRQGKQGEGIVSELHGRYYETCLRKRMFHVATTALVTTSVGLSTTHTGLCLSNPVGSTVLLAINKISMAQHTINAAVNMWGISVGYNAATNVTHTTPVAPRSSYFNNLTTPTALADVSATLPTAPTYYAFISDSPTATTNPAPAMIDLEGSLILPAGAYLCTATAAASTAGFWASFQWEEIPL